MAEFIIMERTLGRQAAVGQMETRAGGVNCFPIMLSLPGSPSGSLQVSSWRPPSRPVAPSLAPSCPPFGIGLLCISLVNHGLPCTLSYLMSALFFLSKYMFLEGAFVCQLQITQNRVLQEILAERNDFLNLKSTAKKYSS